MCFQAQHNTTFTWHDGSLIYVHIHLSIQMLARMVEMEVAHMCELMDYYMCHVPWAKCLMKGMHMCTLHTLELQAVLNLNIG
jgi:hypothetical protein